MTPAEHAASLREHRQWITDWREGMFSSTSRDAEGWPIEMHGVVKSWEEEMGYAEASEERERNTFDALEQARREADELRAALNDVWGTLLAYYTDIPEAEVQRLIAKCAALAGVQTKRIDEGSPHAEPYDVPPDPEPGVKEFDYRGPDPNDPESGEAWS